jgi:hypothetical protein
MSKTYRVIQRFGMYEFNVKNKGSKIVWHEVGETVNQTTKLRMNEPEKYLLL